MSAVVKTENSLKNQWEQRIEEWSTSGQTIAEWCRKKNLPYHQVWYWRERLRRRKRKSKSVKGRFIELKDETQSATRIVVEYRGMQISIVRSFDEESLLRCIRLLRKL